MNNPSAAAPNTASSTMPVSAPLNRLGPGATQTTPMPPALTPPEWKSTNQFLFQNDWWHRAGLQVRNYIRRTMWRHPSLFAINTYRHNRPRVEQVEYDLLVDGFPRSANTFATMAFRHSQGNSFKVLSHVHVPIYALVALRRRAPSVVLVRQPRETLLSWIICCWYLRRSIHFGLSSYIDYYKTLLPHLDRLFVADFDWITGDFPEVVRAANRHFSIHLQVPVANVAFLTEVQELVFSSKSDEDLHFFTCSNPDARRVRFKKELAEIVDGPIYRRGLAQANALYEVFKQRADQCRALVK